MKVLVVKTSSMGDILHTLPALSDAMNRIAGIRFDWVVEENFAQIPSWHPAVDNVLPIALRRWRKNWFGREVRIERRAFRKSLQSRHYDTVIDAQGLVKSAALVTRLAKGLKQGLNYQSAREPLASLWYDKRHNVSRQQHAVERTRELFALSLGYEKPMIAGNYAIDGRFLVPFSKEMTTSDRVLTLPGISESSHTDIGTEYSGNTASYRKMPDDQRHHNPGNDAQNYLVFLHATTRDNKCWPEAYWRDLILGLSATGLRIKLPWGTQEEYCRAVRLASDLEFVDVLPFLTLEAIAKIIIGAKAVVSVDTGLSHLAAALGSPNITLYGPTDPAFIGGYGKNQFALLAHDKRIESVSVLKVKTLLHSLIK